MIIKRIPIRNALRNYMYLLVCEETSQAIAIDPLDHGLCLQVAEQQGWQIKVVANTHHHHDHIGGNAEVIAATGAELVSHTEAMQSIPDVDRGLSAGDTLECGELSLLVMDTPGHTMSHICLFYAGGESEKPALFCGDTLFNAGVGRCDLGGGPKIMYQTFVDQFYPMADDVQVYPGHDYIENNLAFALDREPDNAQAQSLLTQFKEGLRAEDYVSTIGMEREINVFFRLDQSQVRAGVAAKLGIEVDRLDDEATFVGLRGIRDNW